MSTPGSWRGIVNRHKKSPIEVRAYFEHVPMLVEDYPLEVCLTYMFAQVELAQNMTLYHGVTKLHRADSALARRAVDAHHLTREGFKMLFENVFGTGLTRGVLDPLNAAEDIRDKVMHGKRVSEAKKREAIVKVLEFAEKYNAKVDTLAGFKSFRKDLRGVKGRAKALEQTTTTLEQTTTRWMLRGMGFGLPRRKA